MPEPDLSLLRAVRGGEVRYEEVLALIAEAEAKLAALVDACSWEAERAAVDRFLVEAHFEHWGVQKR